MSATRQTVVERRAVRRAARLLFVLPCLAIQGVALAQEGPADPVAAQALFDEGRALMASGRYAEACPKLAASARIDPSGGTLLHLAFCHMKEGKTATAWLEFHRALSVARKDGRADREAAARSNLDLLEPRLSRLTIDASAVRGLPVTISRDGAAMSDAEWNTATPVDPGEHVIAASAPGMKGWSKTVVVGAEGGQVSVTVPALESEVTAAPPSAPSLPAAPRSRPAEASSGGWTQRTTAVVVGGVGLAGIATGAVAGLVSLSKHNQAAARCQLGPGRDACDPAGKALDDDAATAGDVSTVAFAAGGAALATACVLWLLAPASPRVSIAPALAPGRAGISFAARW
jgi:serine/threonine-protein kinase